MARHSVVVRAVAAVLTVGLGACNSEPGSYPIGPPQGEPDAAVDTTASDGGGARDARSNGASDAAIDGPIDAATGADLSISITSSSDPIAASSLLTYTIDVTDHGGLDASNVVVTQRLPPGNVAFQAASGIGWTCSAAGQVVSCTRATLLVGAAPSIAVTVTTPPTGGTITTSATVTSSLRDADLSNNAGSVDTTVLTPADLAIAIADSPDPVAASGTLSYAITVTNTGPGASTGIIVRDTLPSGVSFLSAFGTTWSCSAAGPDVTCLSPTLAASGTALITLIASAPTSGGSVSNAASVFALTPDPDLANNQTTTLTTVNAAADLSIELSAAPSPVPARSTLTYTIAVTNHGPRDATNLVVTDRLPDGNVLFLSAAGIGWACNLVGQQVICTRPSLLVGDAPSIAIQITPPPISGALVDQASVSASTTDLNLADNTASNTTSVFDSADLSIVASEGPNPARIGSDLAYTLAVANGGPTAATVVSVVDTVPAGTAFVSASGTGWSCSHALQVVTCTMPSLATASSAPSISIVVTAPPAAGNITNDATVSSSTSDPDTANNSVTTVTLANAFADLSILVTDDIDPVQGTTTQGCGPSDCVTYSIDVHNTGPDPATGITVITALPPNGTFFNAVGVGWVCPAPSGTLTCTRTRLDAGDAPTIFLTWKAPSPGGFSIVATSVVSGTSTDPNPANNSATQDTTVNP